MSIKGVFTIEKYRGELIDGVWTPVGEPYEVIDSRNSIQYKVLEGAMTDTTIFFDDQMGVAVNEYSHKGALYAKIGSDQAWVLGEVQELPAYTPPVYDLTTPTNGFWTFRSRFIPPSSLRYIRSLALTRITAATSDIGSHALTVLDTPFLQDVADILDITYRVFIDLTPVVNGKVDASQIRANDLGRDIIAPSSQSGYVSGNTRYYPQSRGIEQMKADVPNKFNTMCNWRTTSAFFGSTRDSSLSSVENQVFGHSFNFPIPGAERELHHGLLCRSLMIGSDLRTKTAFIPVDKGVASSVQNTFGRSVDNGQPRFPFLDINNLATSQAAVSITDSGTWASTVNEPFAHHYRVEITTGGLVGTAEYRIRRRRCTGWNRASYVPMTITMSTMKPTESSFTWYLTDDDVRHGQDTQMLVQEYLWPEFISFDATGITVTDVNGIIENIDANSTIPLNVTGLLQVAAAYDGAPLEKTGDLFVACEDTGLWKVERPSGGPVTAITQITPVGITNPNSCRGVTVNRSNGDVWALFHDTTDGILYMAKSTDQGSTWTLYDETTDPQFLLTDYTSGSPGPSNVIALHISPFSADNRFFICAPDVFDTTSGNQGFWWSEAGSSPTSDQVRVNNTSSGNTTSMSHTKLKRLASLSVYGFKTTNTWLFRGTTNHYSVLGTFGSTSFTTNNSIPNYAIGSRLPIVFETSAGDEILLGSRKLSSTNPFYTSSQDTIEGRDPTEYGTNNTNTMFLNGTESTSNIIGDSQSGDPTRNPDIDFDRSLTNILMHIGNGIFLCHPGGAYCLLSLYGDGRVSGEEAHPWFESYGWSGVDWQLDEVGNKVTHSAPEDLLDTLQISFDDNGGTDPLVAGEYYDIYVYDGILLDDATAFSQSYYNFMFATDSGTDFTPSTVPASDVGAVSNELGSLLWQGREAARVGLSRPYAWGEPGKIIAAGDSTSIFSTFASYLEHRLSGDFEFRFKITKDSNDMRLHIGLCDWSSIESAPFTLNGTPGGFTFSVRYQRTGLDNVTGNIDYELAITEISLISGGFVTTIVKTNASENDILAFRRVGTDLELLVNGVVEYTYPSPSSNDLGIIFAQSNSSWGGWTIHDAEVDYTINRRYVSVGNGIDTGAFDVDFRKIVTEPVTATELYIELDGTPATILTDGVTPPAQGEVNVLPYSGRLWFNSADAGAAITGFWRILKKLNLED
jgi:hypothetical protein